MENFGAIIWVIIMIVFGVINATRKNKKKKEQQARQRQAQQGRSQHQPTAKTDKSLEDIFKELYKEIETAGGQQQPKPKPQQQRQHIPTVQEQKQAYQKKAKEQKQYRKEHKPSPFLKAEKELHRKSNIVDSAPLELIDISAADNQSALDFEFDMRQAIIYHTILEPRFKKY